MSRNPSDFIDPHFWDWYRDKGPSWLIDKRLDILSQMYDAYEDDTPDKGLVTMSPGKPFFFMGTDDELEEFITVLRKALEPFRSPKNKSKTPISNIEIVKLHKELKQFKLKRKNNEDNKGKN